MFSLPQSKYHHDYRRESNQELPNPGQDLTYLAQFAQGALMNTAGSSNDAKALVAMECRVQRIARHIERVHSRWLRYERSLARTEHRLSTNLVIGLNAVQEATVNTNSFSVDQGRYAVAQVNYFTKSGTMHLPQKGRKGCENLRPPIIFTAPC
jgi:hypothetical protein